MIDHALAILDHYGLLDRAQVVSVNIKILCPIHEEKTPSCTIDLDRELFYCHGCGAGGTLIQLVQKLERVNELEALRVLSRIEAGSAGNAPIGIKVVLPREENAEQSRKEAQDFFFSLPKPAWGLIQSHYLIQRGFDAGTLRRFDFRINQSADYPIIFPIFDNGEFQGYMTRALDNRPDKYRMSKGMRKSEILCGTVRPGLPILLAEGFLDRVRAFQNGWRNSVSSLNWALSDVQISKLSKAAAVICGLDNDGAGENGYKILKDKLRIPIVRYPFPPWIKDLGEMQESEFKAGMAVALRKLEYA